MRCNKRALMYIGARLDVTCDERGQFTLREAALVSVSKVGDARALLDLEALMRSDNRGLARDAKQCMVVIRTRLNLPAIVGYGA
jgi:hypothetical protein